MALRRMFIPAVYLSVTVILLKKEALTNGLPAILKTCPSRCECSLSTNPHILCRELLSLPGSIPQEARSFLCTNCPLARMTGGIFQNYTGIEWLSLAGESHPVFDQRSLEFLRDVSKLFLEDYELEESYVLALVASNHKLVLTNISVVTSSATTTSQPSPKTTEGVVISPVEGGSLQTSPETSDNRSVGGGAPNGTVVTAYTSQAADSAVPSVREGNSVGLLVVFSSIALVVVLAAALCMAGLSACQYSERIPHLHSGYKQIRLGGIVQTQKSLEKSPEIFMTSAKSGTCF